MKIILSRHTYAPELNRAILTNGATLSASGCQTIKEVRAKLFKPCKPVIVATVSTHYPIEFKGLERTYSGLVSNRKQAIEFARSLREKNPGGKLVNGDYLPAMATTVKTSLRG